MAKVSRYIEDRNARLLMAIRGKHHSEYIDCAQIKYSVNGEILFKGAGKVMIDRRDNYPKLKILSPGTGDYTCSFQENSCVFTDLSNGDVIKIETTYTPNAIGKQVDIEVIITF